MASAAILGRGSVYVASASTTRPSDTTQYAIADLVANSTTAGSVVPIPLVCASATGAGVKICRVRLSKTDTSITSASFRVHFYKASPTPSNGDNAAWLTTGAADYLGYSDVTMTQTFADDAVGFGVAAIGDAIRCMPATSSRTIYALIEARATYTPASAEVFTLYVECEVD